MAEHKETVDDLIYRILQKTRIMLSSEEKVPTNTKGFLCSEGVAGPTPGVYEEGKEWREYKADEIKAMMSGDMGILKQYFTYGNGFKQEELAQKFGLEFAVITQLEKLGVLRQHFISRADGLHHYSVHRGIIETLLKYEINEGTLFIQEVDIKNARWRTVKNKPYATPIEDRKTRLARYDRLAKVGLETEQDSQYFQLIKDLSAERAKGLKMNTRLRGQPFIGENVAFENPEDMAYGDQIERICGLCFFRDGKSAGDCDILVKPTPHELFGVDKKDFLPKQIGGKEVGYYCPHFCDFRAE